MNISVSYNLLKWLSLAFLALFMGFYVKKNYDDEKSNLQKEVGYLFVNAVKDIEGGLLNDIVFKHTANFKAIKRDSVKIMTFIGDNNEKPNNEKFDIKITSDKNVRLNEVHGAISMIMDVRLDSNDICLDSVPRKSIEIPDLEKKFADNLKKANLDIDYQILKSTSQDTTSITKNINSSGTYLDIISGDKYDVEVSSYKGSLLWEILPESLFALFVFTMIGLAFYILQKSMQREKKLIEAKNDFMQNMTHELKTPIATASVALEALTDFNAMEDATKRDEYINVSKSELKRLSFIVDKVLSLQSMDKEKLNAHYENVNIVELTDEVLHSFKIQFSKKGIRIEKQINLENEIVYTDKTLLTGILHNLLDNAIKYNPNKEPVIKISFINNVSNLIIKVMDNGMGVEKENYKKIFQKFFRVPQGNIHNIKGHGLGLSFVESAVHSLGGNIDVESEINQSTSFTIQLPIKNR